MLTNCAILAIDPAAMWIMMGGLSGIILLLLVVIAAPVGRRPTY